MRETENSLRLWFGFVGMCALVSLLLEIEKVYVIAKDPLAIFSTPAVELSVLVSFITVVAYLYVAIKLRDLIVVRPIVIRAVLIVSLLYQGIFGAALVVLTHSPKVGFWPGLNFVVVVYLLFNVNRVARELKE